MPPQIALLLCLLFILYVFRMDYKREPDISNALWIPLIWLVIVGSRPVSNWLNPGTGIVSSTDYETGSPTDRLILSTLIFFGIFILSRRRIELSRVLSINKWIFVWFLFCGVSILWSDFPGVSFKRWIKGIGTVLMVLVVMTEPDPVKASKTLIMRGAYVLITLSILFIKYYRDLGVAYDEWEGSPVFIGVTDSKNTLGRLCLVTGLFFFFNIITGWRNKKESLNNRKGILVNILFFLMILWLLKLSNSATSLAAFIIGGCIFIGLGLPIIKKNMKHIGIILFLSFFIFLILQLSFNLTEIVVEGLGRNMTFTERTDLWKDLLSMDENPLIGTGYDSFWLGNRLESLWVKYRWMPNEAHSGYLEIYLELGLVGLFLLIGILFSRFRSICRELKVDFDYGRLRMAFLVVILLYNITESAFKGITLMWFIFLLIAIDISKSRPEKSVMNPASAVNILQT